MRSVFIFLRLSLAPNPLHLDSYTVSTREAPAARFSSFLADGYNVLFNSKPLSDAFVQTIRVTAETSRLMDMEAKSKIDSLLKS